MKQDKRNQILGVVLLVITALIWGLAFVAQSDAMDHIGPLTMNGTRTLLAALVLLPRCLMSDSCHGRPLNLLGVSTKEEKKHVLLAGLLCGVAITIASTVQQIGIKYTTIGKSGFLTTLYVVFVPILALFLGKRVKWNGWLGVVVAMVGMFLICVHENFTINFGDLLTIISALFFAIHILIVDKYVATVSGVRLSFMQFVVCSITCLIGAFIFETISFSTIWSAMPSILFAGILSAGVGYTLQIIAQKWVAPNIAPLIMCLESVFALLFGSLLRGERMNGVEYIGCALVFIAIVLAQLNFTPKSKRKVVENKEELAE